jgi:hypothetical protein
MFRDSLSKIILWIFFLILFYNVLINIITFIGIDEYLTRMYVFWMVIILLFVSILSPNKIDLNM